MADNISKNNKKDEILEDEILEDEKFEKITSDDPDLREGVCSPEFSDGCK